MKRSASLSPCRLYRYELWRAWGVRPFVMFIGLNPSTADETNDDPTIRRCIAFARAWGFSAICMTKGGHPGHPLYLPGNLAPRIWTSEA
jgi:hypothetical protein